MLTPELIASTYSLLLLVGGCICLGLDIQRNLRTKGYGLEPWRIRIFEFVAFFLGIFAIQAVGQDIGYRIFTSLAGEQARWPYGTVFQFLAAQVGVFGLFAVAMRHSQGFSLMLNPARLRTTTALRTGAFYFMAAIPLLTFTGLIWRHILSWLRDLGWIAQIPYQALVEQLGKLDGPVEWLLVVLMAGIIAPVVEELIFRGALYRFLKGRLHPLVALTLSSLVFALMHFNLLQFVPLFLLAMLLGRSYERSGSILVPIALHACFNLNTLLVFAIAPEILQSNPV
ncbi:CPBP family intramembrane glutamic endopeptidase [Ruficoccus sp. ZRK36]|uniref:CPBP family intramembrane glutamic endopeptidase n=1 Tax=Ruficoccus sp. ZRK36 TaxID=2866311 RepID=UPI001C732F74|nr:CPBP family intramembrane glutamic endopeptidase [Ruficoccus sp. ZRK36]QYY37360.1 CPBP family intramembrane metalloprotease [Ruficoccus sp. ZRK36]